MHVCTRESSSVSPEGRRIHPEVLELRLVNAPVAIPVQNRQKYDSIPRRKPYSEAKEPLDYLPPAQAASSVLVKGRECLRCTLVPAKRREALSRSGMGKGILHVPLRGGINHHEGYIA